MEAAFRLVGGEEELVARNTRISEKRTRGLRLKIALINNMPDAALEDTELQFFELLDAASGDVPCRSSCTRCPRFPAAIAGSTI